MKWEKMADQEEQEYPEAELIKFVEEGDSLTGQFIGIVEFSNDNGEGMFYKFKKLNSADEPIEDELITFPSSVLETKMKNVPIDAFVKIVYKGKVQSKKNKSRFYKDFDVFVGR